jgi:hypothetical protein
MFFLHADVRFKVASTGVAVFLVLLLSPAKAFSQG